LKLESLRYLQRHLDYIYEVIDELPAKTRLTKRGWWADGWSWVTGLATEDEVNSIQDVMKVVNEGIEHAAKMWKAGSSEFFAAIKLEKKRIDNLYKLVQIETSSFRKLHKEILEIYHESDTRMSILGHMINTIKALVFQVSEIDSLYVAVQNLLNNKLPHFLITRDDLQQGLNNVQEFLDREHPGLVLVKQNVKYYFQHATFKSFRHDKQLLILLRAPLTTIQLQNHFNSMKYSQFHWLLQ